MYLHKAVVDLRTKTLEGIFMTQFTLLLCYLTSPFCEQSICCKCSETPCQWGALTLAFAYMRYMYLEGFQFCEAWCQGFWVYYWYGESMVFYGARCHPSQEEGVRLLRILRLARTARLLRLLKLQKASLGAGLTDVMDLVCTRTMNAIHSACQIIAISYSEVPPDIFKFQVFFQFYYKRIIQDFDFWSGCSRVFLLFCTECCRSWYDLVRFRSRMALDVRSWRSSAITWILRLPALWPTLFLVTANAGTWKECWARNADSTIMEFRMDRTDQFMICEFLFALQYMYSESLVSSSAFDKVKFQDHLLVGISLEPWQESLGPVPLLNIQAYGKNQNEFRYHIIKHHQYYQGDLVSGLVGLLVGPVKPFSPDVCRNQMRTDLMALLTHKLLLEVT